MEYKIPLSLIYQHPITGADLQQPMGMGIEVGAIPTQRPTEAPGQSNGQNGQQRGGGGGMNGGGGRGGGRNISNQNNLANDRFSADASEQKVWLKVHWETKP